LRAQYGLKPLYLTVRTSYAGWDDGSGLPTSTWYDNAAADLDPDDGWVLIDHETWPNTTQAERLATATKFATVYSEMKTRRPDLNFGFYGYVAKRDLFRATKAIDHADYLAWQAENDDMAEMAAAVDGFFPTIYFFYTIATDGEIAIADAALYYQRNLEETARLRTTYGDADRPIYPYIHWRRTDDADILDASVWSDMVDAAFSYADGCVLWGGWDSDEQAPAAWADDAEGQAWWLTFTGKLPKLYRAGRSAVMTAAAGAWR
jgi:hypothetical protein